LKKRGGMFVVMALAVQDTAKAITKPLSLDKA
jgi:hypothetical protein